MLEKIKTIKWGYLLLGVLLVAVGICFIAFNNSLSALAVSVGLILAVFGAVFGVSVIASKRRGFYFAVKIVFALVCITAGIITAAFTKDSVKILISLFCLFLIVDGSFKLNTAVVSKRYSVNGWWIMMVIAILIIGSSFLLAECTPERESLASLLLGIIVIGDAVANLLSVFWTAKCETAQKAEIYYDVCQEMKSSDKEN